MDIERARQLRYGDLVRCPEDGGQPAFTGTVRDENQLLATAPVHHAQGVPYIWVTVKDRRGNKAVWPSNRLGTV